MTTTCDLVAERIALGEPLGDAADHAATCSRCRRLLALPAQLGAGHRDADPGIGFPARMIAGTQHRLAVRRRRRIATGLAATTAIAMLAVLVVTRTSEAPPVATVTPQNHDTPATNPKPPTPGEVDDDVRALVHLANVDRSSHLSARWGRIEKPLRPYRTLLKDKTP